MIKVVIILMFISALVFGQNQWTWQNPKPQGNTIEEIFIFDENSILLTTPNMIMKSYDDGESWDSIDVEGRQTPIFFSSTNIGWKLASTTTSGSSILKTLNGGVSWNNIFTDSNYYFTDLCFLNDLVGFVIDWNGTILNTIDGGENWDTNYIEADGQLQNINFSNSKIGWIYYTNHVYLTTDGGLHWNKLSSSLFDDSVFFENDSTVYTCSRGLIKRSNDQGNSWETIYETDITRYLNKLFIKDDTIMAISTDGVIVTSVDNGNTWKENKFDTDWYFTNIMLDNNNTAWSVGRGGIILKSIDGGQSWVNLRKGFGNNIKDVFFLDKETGWIISDEIVFHTENGGNNWLPILNKVGYSFVGIDFVSKNDGWVLCKNGIIFKTIDGGNNWIEQNTNASSDLVTIDFINEDIGMVGGSNLVIMYTSDGGQNWSLQTEPFSSKNVTKLQMITPNISYATIRWDDTGYVLKTEDGGQTWIEIRFGALELYDLSFVDSLRGWVGGDYLYKTVDGGNNWTNQNILSYSIHFTDSLNGWATNRTTPIFHTDDGGNTWEQEISIGTFPNNLFFTDMNHGWFVGDYGMILSYTGDISNIKHKKIETTNITMELNAYPNPFNSSTTIIYSLPQSGKVKLKIYDVLGREIASLVNKEQAQGNYKIEFTAKNLSSGVYFYRLRSGSFAETKKFILLR